MRTSQSCVSSGSAALRPGLRLASRWSPKPPTKTSRRPCSTFGGAARGGQAARSHQVGHQGSPHRSGPRALGRGPAAARQATGRALGERGLAHLSPRCVGGRRLCADSLAHRPDHLPSARHHRAQAGQGRRRERAGTQHRVRGSLATQAVKVFDLVAATGIRDDEARTTGFDPVTVEFVADDHKRYYPARASSGCGSPATEEPAGCSTVSCWVPTGRRSPSGSTCSRRHQARRHRLRSRRAGPVLHPTAERPMGCAAAGRARLDHSAG